MRLSGALGESPGKWQPGYIYNGSVGKKVICFRGHSEADYGEAFGEETHLHPRTDLPCRLPRDLRVAHEQVARAVVPVVFVVGAFHPG